VDVLRSNLELEATTYGRRLVDRVTGAMLPLSDLEAKLLQQWNGSWSAVQLAAQLHARGVEVEAAQGAAFFKRLARLGLLAGPPPGEAGLTPPSPGLEALDDTVPSFRTDLLVDPAPEARGVVQVTCPLTSRTFTLYDFELSVARMLDGRRTARELLASAELIGVPVTLESLQAFLRQLRAWRFLEESVGESTITWRARRRWPEEVRELFQQALRLGRHGQTAQALSCLESVLEVDPENEEAPALAARLEAEQKGVLSLTADFDVLHAEVGGETMREPGPAPAAEDPFDSFAAVTDPAMRAVSRPAGGPALWPNAPEAQLEAAAPGPAEVATAEHPAATPRRRVPVAALAGAAVVAALAAGLFIPVPTSREVGCTLVATERGQVMAPAAGTAVLEVASGLMVKQGERLGQLTPRQDPAAAAALAGKVKALEARAKALAEGPPARVQAAKKALAAAEAAAEPQLKQKAKLEGQKTAAAKKRLAAQEKTLRPRLAAVEKARAALEAVSHAEAREVVEASLAKARQAQESAAAAAAAPRPLVAPAAGVLVWASAQGEVAPGTVLAQVVAPGLAVTLAEPATEPGPVLIRAGGASQEARASAGGLAIEGAPSLAGKACTASLPGGRRPFLLTLF
jgi:tetratricopeptide (TPR) repeat protein